MANYDIDNVKISVKDLMVMAKTIYDEYERPHIVVETGDIRYLADRELAKVKLNEPNLANIEPDKSNLNDPDLKNKIIVGFGVIG